MITFRAMITLGVALFVTTTALVLIVIQSLVVHVAAEQAASGYMDAASANSVSRLDAELSRLVSLIEVLSRSPFLANSDDRSEVDGAIDLFKAALDSMPQMDSLYVG